MEINEISNEQLGHLKNAWDSHKPEWFDENVDPRFLDFLNKLNRHPEMVTMYHCSGHTLAEEPTEASVSSYLVIACRGEMLERLTATVSMLMKQPEYGTVKDQPPFGKFLGWQFEASNTPVTPWYHKAPYLDMKGVPTLVMRFRKSHLEDPTGLETVRIWNELFDQHIFNI